MGTAEEGYYDTSCYNEVPFAFALVVDKMVTLLHKQDCSAGVPLPNLDTVVRS